ncbi:MAG TPA: acyl-CoA reductase [Caulobacteraceae bacterium]|jgi:hypothetical protein|nr:acyl-CoA reductase [Caulobacteraceae bacterium]
MTVQEKIRIDAPVAPMIIRGKVISDNLIEVGGRGGDLNFMTPDAHKYLDLLPLGNPAQLADLYTISFEEILDYLEELGSLLDVEKNVHVYRARELSYLTAPTTEPLIDRQYGNMGKPFRRERVKDLAENSVGIAYLEGWVERTALSGARQGIRCFGARALHIVAGNSPMVSVNTVIKNAILRSDAIIKAPSNDPFTALAIAQTMVDMVPDHPLTKHLSVAYWRGGDVALEEKLYQPHNVEKIVAWGGFSSIKHVTRYIQPGLELISLDPKRSVSVVGKEAFESDELMRTAAQRLAADIGVMNQVGCVNSRISYVMSGTDGAGLEKINTFGQYVYEAMLKLPSAVSTKPKRYDRDLKEHVDALRLDGDWFSVIGGQDDEGAIIVSQMPEAVDFSPLLNDRTANLVPIDTLDEVMRAMTSYTKTVGVFPEALKQDLLNVLPLGGAQRLVSLGYAIAGDGTGGRGTDDGIEIVRRMGKWIVHDVYDPTVTPGLWEA